ncbi:hemagglutinin repeat-containing protein [Xanthomonas campestris]|uniref:Hemagglutinin repeat-containing protein n=1 Tax=Xanthomonas campestris pv. papavericola TaxID=487881 RepID=A0AAJ2X6K6_XANCA|nr:hemagglutinin repeat-containing protein [Xanthomonas campestris]MEC3889690.1 hemagglutinin repeat-containing protein [Xanthomonas campestris pv. papavericola]
MGSSLSGKSVNMVAGNDLALVGSTVLADGSVRLVAGNNVTIESAQDTSSEAHSARQKKSGLTGSSGGGVASVGYSKSSSDSQESTRSVTQVASSVGSTDGNLVISAGNRLTIAASDVWAGKDVTLAAKDIALLARQDTVESQSSQSSKSSGFSIGVTYDPGASYRSARDSTTKNMVDTGSTMSKISRDAEGAAAGTMAAITPVVIQASSHRSNASQNESTSDARISQIAAGGNLTLLASDGSITSQGAQMSAEGNALLLASKDIVFDVAHNTQSSGNASAGKGWGFNNAAGLPYGNYNQQGTGNGQTDTITGTQLSVGGNASLTTTQGDISLTASNIAAQGNVSMRAAGDLTIQSGQDLLGNANQSTSKGIGTVVISDTERFAGYNKKNYLDDNAQISQVTSNVGSLGGNVSLTAGGIYTQSASNVVAAKDVDITAASIQLLTANNTSSASQQDDDLKIGAFARIKSPLIDLINNVDDARKSDGRLGAMQGMAAAANAYQSVKAAKSGTILSIEAGVGFATSESSFNSSSEISRGSTITGGGNVSLKTTEGDLHIVQGNIKAGDTLSLDSARDLILEAGQSIGSEQSKGSNAGFEVGVGAQIGAQTGVYAYVQASAGSHNSNAQSTTWENTQLAGKNVVLTSKGDTTLRGAIVTADRIDANVGGDLTIESLQDVSQIQSKESSVGGRVQVSFGTAWDASGYASGAKANGNYLGVVEQSGLFAGNGGYHVTAGNVNLIGGAIASTNANNSELTADTLTFTDLKNRMDYSTVSAAISGGIGSTGEGAKDADGNPTQPSVGDQFKNIGHNIVNGNYGEANYSSFNPGIPVMQSGSDTTLTRATLTEGNIKIGGKTTTAAALDINTDASAAHEAVAALPDVRKILGEQQAMAAATGTVMTTAKQIGDDIAAAAERKADAIEATYIEGLDTQEKRDAFNALTADQRRDVVAQSNPEYNAAYDSKQHWGVGGDYSRALQAVTTVVVGGVSGQGAGQIATNALAPYAAQLIGKTFDQNHGSDPNAVLQGLSHAVLGAVLAQVSGGSVAGGALAGAGGELAAQYLTKTLYGDDPRAIDPVTGKFNPNLLPEQDKQMLVALSQAVGAIAGGLAGGGLADAAIGANIAKNAVENNWLTESENDYLKLARSLCENGSKNGCDAEEKLTSLDKIRDEEKRLYSEKVTSELKAAGKLTQGNYDKAMEPYWKDQGFFIKERDVVYSGDVSSRTFPTYGEQIYNGMGDMAGNLKYAQPGTALSLVLGRGLLAGLGQSVAGWKDVWSAETAINYFTGESVIGLDALDARVLSLADLLTFGMTETSKARPVVKELEIQLGVALPSKSKKPVTRPSVASADADSEAGLPVTLVPLPAPRNAGNLAGGPLENASQVSGRFKLEGGPSNGTLYRADNQGNVTSYATYDEKCMILKRVDVTGSAHGGVPTPHVIEYGRNTLPDGVIRVQSPSTKTLPRKSKPSEIP